MIAVTPLITPIAVKIGTRWAIVSGFILSVAGLVAMMFVSASWKYVAFVLPLVGIAVGLGLSNGPASSASTSVVAPEEVGQASGISNMARYIGASVAVALVSTIFNAVINNHTHAGASKPDALAAGLAAASLVMAIFCALGVSLGVLMARRRAQPPRAIDYATAAAAASHTIPVPHAPTT